MKNYRKTLLIALIWSLIPMNAQIILKDIYPGPEGAYPELIAINDSGFIFSSFNSQIGLEMYISKGASSNTRLVKDINPGTEGCSFYPSYADSSKYWIFLNQDGTDEMWISDGTESGTTLISEIGYNNYYPNEIIKFKNKYYSNITDTSGQELWVSDGTKSGTGRLLDINKKPGEGSYPNNFISFKDFLYFKGFKNGKITLFKYDGTDSGLTEFAFDTLYPQTKLYKVAGSLYFINHYDTASNFQGVYRFNIQKEKFEFVVNIPEEKLVVNPLIYKDSFIFFNSTNSSLIHTAWVYDIYKDKLIKILPNGKISPSSFISDVMKFKNQDLIVMHSQNTGYQYWLLSADHETATQITFFPNYH